MLLRPALRAVASSALVVSLGVLTSRVARAQTAQQSLLHEGILNAQGPRTTGEPVDRPFFPLWDTEVTPPQRGLQEAAEYGGVAADSRNGWVYAATREGRLVCLDRGREVWSAELGAPVLAAPAVFADSVVVGTSKGVLFHFNKVTGERRSRAVLGEELITQPVVTETPEGGLRAWVGSSEESLFAVDLDLGARLWRAHRDAPAGFTVRGFARPVVTPDAVFAGYADGTVQRLDPVSGVVRWEKRVAPGNKTSATDLIDVDGLAFDGTRLFAATYSGGVYAMEPGTGGIVWRQPMPGVSRLKADGAQLYATSPGRVAALRVTDGHLLWQSKLDSENVSAPSVSGQLVIVAALEGPIYFVDRRSGAPVGVFGTGTFSSPPAIMGNQLHALSNGGRVYALAIAP